jgi:hypothetical protein
MIKERRQIIFDEEELNAALREADKIAPKLKLPANHVAIELRPSENRIFLKFAIGNADIELPVFTLEGPSIAVLLMAWCKTKNIPIPRLANKSFIVTDHSIILSLQ